MNPEPDFIPNPPAADPEAATPHPATEQERMRSLIDTLSWTLSI